ncbi:hypothetical protein BH11BAC2_BH11BAC2_18090 [soil metagenome]
MLVDKNLIIIDFDTVVYSKINASQFSKYLFLTLFSNQLFLFPLLLFSHEVINAPLNIPMAKMLKNSTARISSLPLILLKFPMARTNTMTITILLLLSISNKTNLLFLTASSKTLLTP